MLKQGRPPTCCWCYCSCTRPCQPAATGSCSAHLGRAAKGGVLCAAPLDHIPQQRLLAVVGGEDGDLVGGVAQQPHVLRGGRGPWGGAADGKSKQGGKMAASTACYCVAARHRPCPARKFSGAASHSLPPHLVHADQVLRLAQVLHSRIEERFCVHCFLVSSGFANVGRNRRAGGQLAGTAHLALLVGQAWWLGWLALLPHPYCPATPSRRAGTARTW